MTNWEKLWHHESLGIEEYGFSIIDTSESKGIGKWLHKAFTQKWFDPMDSFCLDWVQKWEIESTLEQYYHHSFWLHGVAAWYPLISKDKSTIIMWGNSDKDTRIFERILPSLGLSTMGGFENSPYNQKRLYLDAFTEELRTVKQPFPGREYFYLRFFANISGERGKWEYWLRKFLEFLDSQKLPTYWYIVEEELIRLYERCGFVISHPIIEPESGISFWQIARDIPNNSIDLGRIIAEKAFDRLTSKFP